MKKPLSLYYLYCMNAKCQMSIYHRMVEVQLPFTEENIVARHFCTCCNMPLVSAMDVEIKHVITQANFTIASKVSYLQN